MDISPEMAVNSALNIQQGQLQQQAQISMLKKAMEIQTQGSVALIESLAAAPSTQGLPANLGNNINTTA